MPTPVKLLLIDDQPSFVRGLTRLLHRDGYTVETVANGHEALAQLLAHHYDVIICDLQMPTLDGHAFYDLLRRQFPSLCQRVIFVTGDTLGVDSTAFLAQCGQPYLYKPCTAAEVRSTIQQTLHAGASITQGRAATGAVDTGVSMREEGTLSIVQRSYGFQVRYASNNPYAQERLPCVCPDTATLSALLHQLGTEAEPLDHACAVARNGGVAVLRVLIASAQIQAYFRPAFSTSTMDDLADSRQAAQIAHHQ